MQSFSLAQLAADCEKSQRPWLEFLRVASLSVGVYCLRAGEADLQQPHSEDEVYYVVSGKGRFQAGDNQTAVEAGSILFVPRYETHRFLDISDDLTVFVFFAPPEGSQREV